MENHIINMADDKLPLVVINKEGEIVDGSKANFEVFDVNKFTKNKYSVYNRKLQSVRIICTDRNNDLFPIIGLIEDKDVCFYTNKGYTKCCHVDNINNLIMRKRN